MHKKEKGSGEEKKNAEKGRKKLLHANNTVQIEPRLNSIVSNF